MVFPDLLVEQKKKEYHFFHMLGLRIRNNTSHGRICARVAGKEREKIPYRDGLSIGMRNAS